jgi:hypothetical protein
MINKKTVSAMKKVDKALATIEEVIKELKEARKIFRRSIGQQGRQMHKGR